MILILGKARSCSEPILGYTGGRVTWLIWCFTKKLCTRCDSWVDTLSDEAAHHQLPIAVAFWIIRIVSTEKCSSLMQNLMQIHCSTCLVILNATATQYTCSLNDIYCLHWLVQWNCCCSHMCIPVHSPWLPGYIDVTQTVLVILTMAGHFPDRPHIYSFKVYIFIEEFWV